MMPQGPNQDPVGSEAMSSSRGPAPNPINNDAALKLDLSGQAAPGGSTVMPGGTAPVTPAGPMAMASSLGATPLPASAPPPLPPPSVASPALPPTPAAPLSPPPTPPVPTVNASAVATGSPATGTGAKSAVSVAPAPPKSRRHLPRARWLVGIAAAVVVLGSLIGWAITRQAAGTSSDTATAAYNLTSIPLGSLSSLGNLSIDSSQQLVVNGQLRINNTAVIAATGTPAKPVDGQIYLSKANQQLYYYNGSKFVDLANPDQQVTTLGGLTGAVGLGVGLAAQGGQLVNSGVTSLQGQQGSVNLAGGRGIQLNGTTIANSGVLSLQGQTGAVTLTAGDGIGISGLTLTNQGVTSLHGTVDQVDVSQANGSVSLSLPQNIDSSATPSFANLNLSDLAANSVVVGGGSGPLTALTPSVGGECLLSNPSTSALEFGSCNSGAAVVTLRGLTGALNLVGGTGITVSDNGSDTITVASTGVTSLNSASGALSIANTTTAAGVITVNDASTSQKGIASFTSGDFSVTAGAVSLGAAVTKAGNTFNANNDLVQLNATGGAAIGSGECLVSTGAGTNGAAFSASACGNISSGTSQTAGQLTMFDVGTNQITDSILSQSGTTLTAIGTIAATNLSGNGTSVTNVNAADLQSHPASFFQNAGNINAGILGVAEGGTGLTSLTSKDLLVGNGTAAATLLAPGSNGQCLVVVSGAPAYATCPGANGVTSLNGQTGDLSLQAGTGISFDSSTLTFSNAGVTGLAGTTNQIAVTGSTGNITLSLPQSIATGSAVQFGSLTLGTALSVANGGTGATAAPAARTNLGAAASGANADITSLTALSAIDPVGALTIGDPAQTLTLQGDSASSLAAYDGSNSTTLGFTDPTGTNTITLPNASGTVAISGSGAISLDAFGNITCPDCLTTTGSGGGSGVTDVNGVTNSVTLQAGTGITVTTNVGAGTITVASSGGSGVTSLNSLSGALSINDATGSGSTVTIQNASLAQKGIAQFNTGDFTASSGTISLDSSVTKAGNTFNGDGDLVQLDNPGGGATSTGECLRSTSTGAAFSACPAGGNISSGTSQTAGQLTMFDSTTDTITDSLASQSGSTISVSGTLAATNLSGSGTSVTNVNAAELQGHAASYFQDASNISSGILNVAYGGTGLNTVDSGALLIGNGTSAMGELDPGTDGECLIIASGAPAYGSCSGSAAVLSINTTHTGNVVISAGSGISISDTLDGIEIDSTAGGLTLQDAYNNTGSTVPKIKVSSANGGLDIQDADTAIGGSIFAVRGSNGSGQGNAFLRVDSSGRVSIGVGSLGTSAAVIYLPASTSTDALQVYNGLDSIFRIASDGSISGTNAIFDGSIATTGDASFESTNVNGLLSVNGNITQTPGFSLGVGTTTPSATLEVDGTKPGLSSVNGINATKVLLVNGGAGGDTSGTSGQRAGSGSSISLNAGVGGDAATGSTNGDGGSITLQGGAPGSGTGTAGQIGTIVLQANGGGVGIGTNVTYGELTVAGAANSLVNLQSSANTGAINIVSDYGSGADAAPGLTWSSPDNNAGVNKAGIIAEFGNSGSSLLFGTSNSYVTGITNTALRINPDGSSVFQVSNDSTNAFVVQNASQQPLLNIDSTNSDITLGNNQVPTMTSFNTSTGTGLPNITNQASVTANGYIYVLGGDNGTTAQATAYYAQINSEGNLGDWTTTTALPAARDFASAVTSAGYVYVIGGSTTTSDAQATNTILYAKQNSDGTLGAWKTETPTTIAFPVNDQGSSAVYNGYIYVAGGRATGITYNAVHYMKINADGSVGAINTTVALPNARSATSLLESNGYLYQFGGFNSGAQDDTDYAKINADGTIGSWNASFTFPTNYSYGAVIANGFVYAVGGHDGSSLLGTVWGAPISVDGSVGSWTSVSGLPTPLDAASTVTANGYIYEIGGNDGSGAQSSVYYGSTSRIQLSGSLDLVGQEGNGSNLGSANGGGSLTAGNTDVVGDLNVVGQTTIGSSLQASGNLTVGGQALFQNSADSTTAVQIQNSAGTSNLFDADTSNSRIGIGTNAPGNLLSIGALTTASASSQLAVSIPGTTNSGIVVQESQTTPTTGFFLQAQNSSGSNLASIDYQGNLVVQAATVNGSLTLNGHLITGGGTPTWLVNANAGSGASCSVTGTDTAGTITVVTGTGTVVSGTLCTVTFHTAYGSAPQVIVGSKAKPAAQLAPYSDSVGTASFDLGVATNPSISTTYTFEYIAAQ